MTLLHLNPYMFPPTVCSAYPTSGGLYYWSAALSKPKYRSTVSFFAGWFNLIGYLTGYASTNFGLSMLLTSAITVATDGAWIATPISIVFVYFCAIIIQALISTFAHRLISGMMMVSSRFSHLILKAYPLKHEANFPLSVLAFGRNRHHCGFSACMHTQFATVSQIRFHRL